MVRQYTVTMYGYSMMWLSSTDANYVVPSSTQDQKERKRGKKKQRNKPKLPQTMLICFTFYYLLLFLQ